MRRKRRSRNVNLSMHRKSKEIVSYWILKMLIDLNATRDFMNSMHGFSDDSIAYFLDLDAFVDDYDEKDKKAITEQLKAQLDDLESKEKFSFPKILEKNIKRVKKLVNLNRVEKDILIFTIYLKYIDMMDNATRMLNDLSTDRLVVTLSVLLGHKASKVKEALTPQAKLACSGL